MLSNNKLIMEKNIYLFIIWNRVLWAKKRIIDDLSSSFEIVKEVKVNWDKNKYIDNLLALYGTKTNNATDKLKAIGYGDFCLILVKDNKEEFITVKKYDREEYVNKNINEKKKLYRKWTGTDFRIHSSENYNETIHDLTILFGNNYEEIINNASNTISLNTKGIQGFDSIDDLCINIKNFGDIVYLKNNHVYILARKRNDILRFVSEYKIKTSTNYLIVIGSKYEEITIFGEEEGDIPYGMLNTIKINKEFEHRFVNLLENYLANGVNDKNVISLLNYYDLDTNLIKKQTIREKTSRNCVESLKKEIKYYSAWLLNGIYLLKNK